jgi:hypothetical protein
MTVQWSRELLECHIAPGIYDFDRAEIPELSLDLMESGSWMFDHFVNSVFRGQYKDSVVRKQVINCIYRAQTAIRAYQEAMSLTASYLSKSKLGSPVISLYFEMLSKWEMCILNWQKLGEVYNKLSCPEKAFKNGDGSIDERAWYIANSIKHSGKTESGTVTHTVPMWLTNDGFQTKIHSITYEELAQLMTRAGEFAQQIIDPKSATNSGSNP